MDWQKLPEWARYALIAFASATLGVLIALYREALAGLLRRAGERLAGLLGQNWADRRFERRYLKWLAGECEKVSLIGVLPATPERAPRLPEVFVAPALSERRPRLRPPREFPARGEEGRPPLPEEWEEWEAAREEARSVPLPEALGRQAVVLLGNRARASPPSCATRPSPSPGTRRATLAPERAGYAARAAATRPPAPAGMRDRRMLPDRLRRGIRPPRDPGGPEAPARLL